MKNNNIDMINGPLLGKMMIFSIPVVLSTILQFTFNATDTIIAGRFAASDSLAAIGSTTPVVNMIINLFIGFSICANGVTSQLYGKGNKILQRHRNGQQQKRPVKAPVLG